MTSNIPLEGSSPANPSEKHHHPQIHSDNTSTGTKYAGLSSLPLELQYSIFILLPPQQLFTLRRVSRSWRTVLQNQYLLEQINKQLPFLTSAPDLCSRMKRRMRMLHRKPVWVRNFSEAFPWVSEFLDCAALDSAASARPENYDPCAVTRFWNGWVVVIKQSSGGPASAHWSRSVVPSRSNSNLEVKLKIKSLVAQDENTGFEIDVLAEFKRINPGAYRECIDGYLYHKGAGFMFLEFSVQEGAVVVGFQGDSRKESARRRPQGVFYFFIFSITTGELLQHIHRVSPPPSGADWSFKQSRLSPTHFLTIHTTEYFDYPIGESPYLAEYWIDIYSHQDYDGWPEQSIIATLPKGFRRFGNFDVDNSQRGTCFLDQFEFDHLGRVWLPYIEGTKLVVTSGNKLRFGAERDQNRLDFGIENLPKSKCGTWSIVPSAAAEELDLWNKILENSRCSAGLKDHNASPTQSQAIAVAQPQPLENQAEKPLPVDIRSSIECYQGRLCTVDSRLQMQPWTPRTPANDDDTIIRIDITSTHDDPFTNTNISTGTRQPPPAEGDTIWSDLIKTQTYSTHQLSPDGFHGKPNSRVYEVYCFYFINELARLLRGKVYSRKAAPWGFMDCARAGQRHWDNNFSFDLFLLPFDGKEPLTWPQPRRSNNPLLDCVWVNDGLICWQRSGHGHRGRSGATGRDLVWLVCYEESWVPGGGIEFRLPSEETESWPSWSRLCDGLDVTDGF